MEILRLPRPVIRALTEARHLTDPEEWKSLPKDLFHLTQKIMGRDDMSIKEQLPRRLFLKLSAAGTAVLALVTACKTAIGPDSGAIATPDARPNVPTALVPTPELSGTKVAPTQAEAQKIGSFTSAEIMNAADAYAALGPNLKTVVEAAESQVRNTPDYNARSSDINAFVIVAATKDGQKIAFPFLTVTGKTPDAKTFTAAVFTSDTDIPGQLAVFAIPLIASEHTPIGSDKKYSTLDLTVDPQTGKKISDWSILTLPMTITEYNKLSASQQASTKILFSPYGYEDAGPNKEASVTGIAFHELIATATPEAPAQVYFTPIEQATTVNDCRLVTKDEIFANPTDEQLSLDPNMLHTGISSAQLDLYNDSAETAIQPLGCAKIDLGVRTGERLVIKIAIPGIEPNKPTIFYFVNTNHQTLDDQIIEAIKSGKAHYRIVLKPTMSDSIEEKKLLEDANISGINDEIFMLDFSNPNLHLNLLKILSKLRGRLVRVEITNY